MSTTRSRLSGLGATLLICLFVIAYPLVLLAIGVTPWRESVGDIGALLTSPDDGTLALLLVGVLAWLLWALGTVLFAVEVVATLRGVAAPSMPGLGLPQTYARHLVTVAALLFVAAPTFAPAFAPQPAHAAPTTEIPTQVAPTEGTPATETQTTAAPEATTEVDPASSTRDYAVQRGDSLWKIAQEQLGDGMRFREIVTLNESVLHGRANFISPGLVLRLPDDAAPAIEETEPRGEDTYVVEPGDTLWDIAEEELGEGDRYPEVFEASRGTVQSDGHRLTDPDLIRPGWELTIPGEVIDTPPENDPPEQPPDPTPELDETPEPTPEESAAPPLESAEDEAGRDAAAQDTDGQHAPAWLLPGLAGAGVVVAAGVLVGVRRHRRMQMRYRTPGQMIAPPPEELRPIAKTIRHTGAAIAPPLEALDALLRQLSVSAEGRDLPSAIAVELTGTTTTLHLTEHAILPSPWTSHEQSQTVWTAALDDAPETAPEWLAPYPMLVTVGSDDAGGLWLLNLEQAGHTVVVGDTTAAESLVRHVAAELILDPWAVHVHVDVVAIADELTGLDPIRLQHHSEGDRAFLDQHAAELAASARTDDEPEQFHALLAAEALPTGHLEPIAQIITDQPGRSGAALVTLGPIGDGSGFVLDLTDGRLRIPALGLDLDPAGLTPSEARTCAAIVEVTRDAQSQPIPVREGIDGGEGLSDEAGALNPDLVVPRPTDASAGEDSLLPAPAREYEDVGATTSDDVDALAPITPATTRAKVVDADPLLEADLADWSDPDCPRPKLSVLGPVTVRAHGRALPKRKPYYTELVAYLALRPEGVTARQLADTFDLTPGRARTDVGVVRAWLGNDPRTRHPYLPSAETSSAADDNGVPAYRINGLLSDLELFRRLRTRGQARGASGLDDLIVALGMVAGPPFSQLRDNGWHWLFDGDPVDHIAECAIVDVAHLIATRALHEGDLDLARSAAETAFHAVPGDETCRLDLVAVAVAEGHGDLVDERLSAEVFNRTDDDYGPPETAPRTRQVVDNRQWRGVEKQRRLTGSRGER